MEETELVEKKEDGTEIVKLTKPAKVGQFIRPVGCDIKEGQTIVEKGEQIGPAEIGLLAGAGNSLPYAVPYFFAELFLQE